MIHYRHWDSVWGTRALLRVARPSPDPPPAARACCRAGRQGRVLGLRAAGQGKHPHCHCWHRAALERNKVSRKVVSSFHHREANTLINIRLVVGYGGYEPQALLCRKKIPKSMASLSSTNFADSAAIAKPLPHLDKRPLSPV